MAKRALSQKLGARGHRWMMSKIEDHDDWLARSLDEDFGIDAEAELTEDGVFGQILKLQFKTSTDVERKTGKIKVTIERKYLDYAKECRYPVIFVCIDITTRKAWYLWLQKWILVERSNRNRLDSQESFVCWIPEDQTIEKGLDGELKDIATWRSETQLTLCLLDTLRAVTATYDQDLITRFIGLVGEVAPDVADTSLDIIAREAAYLGQRLRGTAEGVVISEVLFELVRRFGGRLSIYSVREIVQRDDTYSRIGLIALGVLYDDFPDNLRSFGLPQYFIDEELPEVAYYCALREAFPKKRSLDFLIGPGDFKFAGLKFVPPENESFGNKYANRGPSAILDCLEFEKL